MDELQRINYSSLVNMAIDNEPFMHPLLMDFCEQISVRLPKARGLLVTNGALMQKEHYDFLSGLATTPLILLDDYTPDHRVIKRIKEWQPHGNGKLEIIFRPRSWNETQSNMAGNKPIADLDLGGFANVACTWPFTTIFFNARLEAVLCCSDYHHEFVMGNLARERLMDIWNNAKYQAVRQSMLKTQREHLNPCRQCDMVRFVLPMHCDPAHRPRPAWQEA